MWGGQVLPVSCGTFWFLLLACVYRRAPRRAPSSCGWMKGHFTQQPGKGEGSGSRGRADPGRGAPGSYTGELPFRIPRVETGLLLLCPWPSSGGHGPAWLPSAAAWRSLRSCPLRPLPPTPAPRNGAFTDGVLLAGLVVFRGTGTVPGGVRVLQQVCPSCWVPANSRAV